MKYNFKEYEIQDLTYKGPMRRRYNDLVEKYKGYNIFSYIRGEYTRYSVEDDKEISREYHPPIFCWKPVKAARN